MFHAKLRILHLQLQQRVLRRHRPVAHGRNMGAETWWIFDTWLKIGWVDNVIDTWKKTHKNTIFEYFWAGEYIFDHW